MNSRRFDLASAKFNQDPSSTFATLRALGPLVRTRLPIIGEVWLATTYDSAREILRDHETFVRQPDHAGKRSTAAFPWWIPRMFHVLIKNMLGKDEPDHRRLRTLVDDAFLRRSIEVMRPRMTVMADRFLDDWVRQAADGGAAADLIRHFARPFPLAVICELLGLPEEDRPKFTRWAGNFMRSTSVLGIMTGLHGLKKLQGYLKREFQRCRDRPRPGLISELVASEQRGDRLDEGELLAMVFLLLLAGHETTVLLISGGVHALLEHPDQKARLLADWSLAGSAVDEVLRFVSPVQMTKQRYASRDLELHGRSIRRGEALVPLLGSANHDPERFEDPERFDITRSPNPHLGFGTGIHVCLGLKLARAEAEIAFERVFTRYPDLAISAPPSSLSWIKRIGIHGLSSLPTTPSGSRQPVEFAEARQASCETTNPPGSR